MTDNSFKILNKMLSKDHFSKWLGLNVLELSPGYCKLSLRINKKMLKNLSVNKEYRFVNKKEINQLAIPSLIKKILTVFEEKIY